MKKCIVAASMLVAVFPGIAFAQSQSEATNTSTTTTETAAQAIVGGTTFNSHNEQPVSSAVAPSMVASGQLTCNGLGVSGAAQTDVAGISLAIGGRDRGCDDARRTITIRGGNTPIERVVAAIHYCQTDREVREAWETAGYSCSDIRSAMEPQLLPASQVAARAPQQAPVQPAATPLAPARTEPAPERRTDIGSVQTASIAGPTQ